MNERSVIKTYQFAAERHFRKIDTSGDPLAVIESHIDHVALATGVDRAALSPVSSQGGGLYPTETMVRILILKRLYNLPNEQVEYATKIEQIIEVARGTASLRNVDKIEEELIFIVPLERMKSEKRSTR